MPLIFGIPSNWVDSSVEKVPVQPKNLVSQKST